MLLPAAYLVGLTLYSAWYLTGYAEFCAAVKKTFIPAGAEEVKLLHTLGGGRLRLYRSAAVPSPLLLGLLRPTLVLPDRRYDEATLINVLRHELTHYRRGDILYKWFAQLVFSLHWFNPLCLLMRRELNCQCELSCDERLLRDMDKAQKQSYGETLLAMAAARPIPSRAVATSFSTQKRELKERLEQIMSYRKKGRLCLVVTLIFALLLCGCGAVMGPERSTAQSETPETVNNVPPTPEAQEDMESVSLKAQTRVEVDNVDALLSAIGPDTLIQLAPGYYDLAAASDYGQQLDGYYTWEPVYDGYELVITGVENMSIHAGGEKTTISAVPRYADVLVFNGCRDVELNGLTLGHAEGRGICAGGVVEINAVDRFTVSNCNLYGCGIIGLRAFDCTEIKVYYSHIYDCSDGAVQLESCYDVLFDGCQIYLCNAIGPLFRLSTCSEIAFINGRIYGNVAQCLVQSSYCKGVYLWSNELEDNVFNSGVFNVQGDPVQVEGCSFEMQPIFQAYCQNWDGTDTVPAVDAAGNELGKDELKSMALGGSVRWQAAERPDMNLTAPEAGEDGMIHVSTVDEFLAAIAPGASIYLEDGVFDLSTASQYGAYGGEYYSWMECFDGPSLIISNVDNLSIAGGGADKVTVAAIPRYADVLTFQNCNRLQLSGFTMGHTEEPGSCTGGVLNLSECDNVSIDKCGLFGCGIIGIMGYKCDTVTVNESEIYDCSYGEAQFIDCFNVAFTDCDIHDNGPSGFMIGDNCGSITVDGVLISQR